jgi:hypothetical protein
MSLKGDGSCLQKFALSEIAMGLSMRREVVFYRGWNHSIRSGFA